MKRLALAIVTAVALAAAFVSPVRGYDWTVSPNSLKAGPISFTETYPKEAARSARNPQFHDNPVTWVFCDGGFSGATIVDHKWAVPGGFGATTYPLTVPAGECSVTVVYWRYDKVNGAYPTTVSWAAFTVEP